MVKPNSLRKKSKQKSFKAASTTPVQNVDQLISEASACENNFEPLQALRLYDKALKQLTKNASSTPVMNDPKYVQVLRSSAYVLLELGRNEEAKKRLLDICQIASDPGYETYMYLGQLSTGEESLKFYRHGIELIHKQAEQPLGTTESSSTEPSLSSVQSLSRAESTAWCAVAGLYMSDLCDLPEAQSECTKALDAATQIDPTNPQAWLTQADYYVITEQDELACASVEKCIQPWWSKMQAALDELDSHEPGSEELTEQQLDLEELTGIPSSGLILLARTMLALNMEERAQTLLEACLEEDEDNLEVYYLLTKVGEKLLKEDNPDVLRHYASTTKVMASKLGDIELVDEMTELLAQLPAESDTHSNDALESISSSDDEESDKKEMS